MKLHKLGHFWRIICEDLFQANRIVALLRRAGFWTFTRVRESAVVVDFY